MRRVLVDEPQVRLLLNRVEKPGRYVGGEFGTVSDTPNDDDYTVCVVFPDLYEIGMSNQAVRILYKAINDEKGLHAERAFSPAKDFASGLKENNLRLYSLENGFELRDFDLLAVTIGYELSFTNFLGLLDSAGIPPRKEDRTEEHPIVIAGGPAMTNPAPWAGFVDAVYIGEAEGEIAGILQTLRSARNKGISRAGQKKILDGMAGFWTAGSPTAERQVWMGFGVDQEIPAALPIPSMQPVQDHGVIEIMRGCPNKCRFCHAGVFYRPYRQKSVERIIEEARYLVDQCGYRDITLSSLSTGDYAGLEPLVEKLNRLFAERRVSFSLPSLRVNSITLSLIGRLGVVRKSGLTFAVETPTVEGQRGINKEVPADRVVEILLEAKREGWNLAKFYFMLGLPVSGADDTDELVSYILRVQRETGIKLNINLGTFIPKPHTPFERARQLTDGDAIDRIRRIRDGLRSNNKIRFTFHSPFVSFLEGILSRGDHRAGELAYQAWLNGAAFDAWDDLMDKDAWKNAISSADWDVEAEICKSIDAETEVPWNGVDLGISDRHLAKENSRGSAGELTVPCSNPCTDHCGVCDKSCKVRIPDIDQAITVLPDEAETTPLISKRLLLSFSKKGKSVYIGHLDVMNVFEKSIQRAGIEVDFTQGFNPKPRIEFAQPLSLGLLSEEEICSVSLRVEADTLAADLSRRLNFALPEGIRITQAAWIPPTPEGKKKPKVMSLFWGSEWGIRRYFDIQDPSIRTKFEHLDEILAAECEKRDVENDVDIRIAESGWIVRFRHGGTKNHNLKRILEEVLLQAPSSVGWEVTRLSCYAKNPSNPEEASSYWEVFAASQ